MIRRARRRELRRLLLGPVAAPVFLLGPALVWCVLGSWIANREVERVATRHLDGRESLDELLVRFPRAEENDAARKLEELSARLGVDLARKGATPRRPDASSKKRFDVLKGKLSSYFEHSKARADDEIAPLPRELTEFLSVHRADIQALVDQLEKGEPPVWPSDYSRGFDIPLPNLLGHLQLQRVLLLDALESEMEGRTELSLSRVDAAWRLNDALRGRLDLISQLIAIASDRLQQRVLRSLSRVPEGWDDRLRRFDWREAGARAIRGEALGSIGACRRPAVLTADMDRPMRPFVLPYVMLGLADHADRMDRLGHVLGRLNARDLEGGTIESAWTNRSPWWNIIGKIAWPDLASSTRRCLRLLLDIELTGIVVKAKRGDSLSESVPSTCWPGHEWRLKRDTRGDVSEIDLFPRYREAKPVSGVGLPLRFVSRRGIGR